MNPPDQPELTWIKASKSFPNGACVELAQAGETIYLRDSKHPDAVIRYSPAEIDAFLDGAKRGEFDHLIKGA